MKTKIFLFAIATCISAILANARTAPTLPKAQALESGKTYYLYNVDCDRFVSRRGWGAPIAKTDEGTTIKISLVNGSQYNIQYENCNDYWYSSWGGAVDIYYDGSLEANRFQIRAVTNGYTIQRVYGNPEGDFVGYDGSNVNYITTGVKGENIVWQLFDPIEAARFIAKRNLYRALESNVQYNIDEYETVYENEAYSNTDIQAAADKLNNALYITNRYESQDWSDYPILFSSPNQDWECYSGSTTFFSQGINDGAKTTLQATIDIDDNSTLVYKTSSLHNKVYLDDELVAYNNNSQAINGNIRHFIEMKPGKHIIKWTFENYGSHISQGYVGEIGIEKTPTIYVSLPRPGSIGTEVLKETDHLQNVRKLVVSGPMNSEDWDKIMLMTSLFTLDLTNADIKEIPEKQLSRYYHNNNLSFFHEVKLPAKLDIINDYAFQDSYIENISFPEGLTTIGRYAFCGTKIKEAIIPESVNSIGEYAFASNHFLSNVLFPASAKVIPKWCFYNCQGLMPFEIPEGIISIGREAFCRCYSFSTNIPSSVSHIDRGAFNNCNLNNVIIHENVNVSEAAFEYCKLKTIEFPTSMFNAPINVVQYCTNLTDIYLKSPTIVTPNNMLYGCDKNILTIHVPDYLVSAYKLDSYWYNYKIEGFNTSEIKDWYVKRDLILEASTRLEGQPSLSFEEWGTLKISGDKPMTINNLNTCKDWDAGSRWNTMILSECNSISINGDYTHRVYTPEKRWVFICLPFDTKVGDIKCEASFAIRYYDGANRAKNGSGGSWKNFSNDDIIPAGTGFILQTSKECSTFFKAQDNATKQFVFSNNEYVKKLNENISANTADKGWNLVGNPWLSYYNIHKVNFTAPITIWNVSNQNYTAYSIIDDDYAILPNQAFFVQCPDEINSISLPIDGRQLTSVIENQNGVKAYGPQKQTRWLIDIELSDGNLTDKTRFVMNEEASIDYETQHDASKFFSMDPNVPQIYTIENDVQLAINERPLGEGTLQIGFKVATDGNYTILASRNQFQKIVLVDNETGIETDLATGSYTFSANKGTNEERFFLRINGAIVTDIKGISTQILKEEWIYNLNGQRINQPQKGLNIINRKKVLK